MLLPWGDCPRSYLLCSEFSRILFAMQFSSFASIGLWPIVVSFILVLYALSALWVAYGSSLREVPGPTIAKFTRLWLFFKTSKFQTHTDYLEWHEKYGNMKQGAAESIVLLTRELGNLVRISPEKVSVADPAMIPVIYKVGSKFNKVRATPTHCQTW